MPATLKEPPVKSSQSGNGTKPPQTHILDEAKVQAAIRKWKNTRRKQFLHEASLCFKNLAETVIRTGGFTRHAPLEDLWHDTYAKIVDVIGCDEYDPKEGTAFNFFSRIIRNFLISHCTKLSLRNRTVVSDTDWINEAADELRDDRPEQESEFHKLVLEHTVRWWDPPESDAAVYFLSCIWRNGLEGNQQSLIRTAACAYGISYQQAQLIFWTVLSQLRLSLLDRDIYILSGLDIVQAQNKFSLVHELVRVLGEEQARRLVLVFNGMTLKIPDLEELRSAEREAAIYNRALNTRRKKLIPHDIDGRVLEKIGNGSLFHKRAISSDDADTKI